MQLHVPTLLNPDFSIERFFVEMKLSKKKWLFTAFIILKLHQERSTTGLEQHEKVILIGDFKNTFNGCKSIVRDKYCFKTPLNRTCIDLMDTCRPKFSQEPEVIETGLSQFHQISLTILKVFFNKQKQRVSLEKKTKSKVFMHELVIYLGSLGLFGTFKTTVDSILQKHVSIKGTDVSWQMKLQSSMIK